MRIYTRGGDKGKTKIHGGDRVDKDDIRIEANGTLDELNSMIGIVRSILQAEHEIQPVLYRVQREMMSIMSHVATPSAIRHNNPNPLDETIVEWVESVIDDLTGRMGESSNFILPGGTVASAHLQYARTIARRAERRLWTLNKTDTVPDLVLRFINRLSDLLFTMARFELQSTGNPEEVWKDFLYKRKKIRLF